MKTILTQQILESRGFTRDTNCPDGVNRWERNDNESHFQGGWFVSVTFKDSKGSAVDYAVINHYTAPHGYENTHRSIKSINNGHIVSTGFLEEKFVEGDVTVEEFDKLIKP